MTVFQRSITGYGVGLLILLMLLLTHQLKRAEAQPIYEWSDSQLTLGWSNPVFDPDLEYDPSTSSAFIKAQWPVGDRLNLRVTLPGIHYQRPESRASLLGNPSIGIQKTHATGWSYSVDLLFPLTSNSSGEAAYVASRIEYPGQEQFYDKSWSVRAGGAYRYNFFENFTAKVSGRLQSTADHGFEQVDWYVDYALEVRRSMRQIHYDLSWQGSMLAASDWGTLGDDFGHLLQLGFGYKTALVDPRMHFSVPLNPELSRDIDYVLGISVTVDMSKLRWPG